MKFNWHGVSAAATALATILLSPAVFNLLPPKVAGAIGGGVIIWQALTKPAVVAAPTEAQQAASGK